MLPRAAALPPGPSAAGAGPRALALGRLGPGQPLRQLGFPQSGAQGRVRGALGTFRAGGGADGGGARIGAAGRGGWDAEEHDTVQPGTGTAGRSDD